MGGDWREGTDEGKGEGGGFFLCMISGQGAKRRGEVLLQGWILRSIVYAMASSWRWGAGRGRTVISRQKGIDVYSDY